MVRTTEHKHLGIVLDEQLNFQGHIKEMISKARRGIGLIRHLSKYLSRHVFDQIYKLHVRPHLHYGDIVHHKNDPDMKLDFTRRLEQVQYSAALAVSGAWRGTSSRKLYEELGWESLYLRRWYRRMCHFYNLKKTVTPAYLFEEIPVERNVPYNLRFHREYQPVNRTEHFASTYFQNLLSEWNLLDTNIKESNTLEAFKSKLLGVIRPIKKSMYNIYNITGIRKLTKMRVNFSPLNEHRFRHSFDCLSPRCACGEDNEYNVQFFLRCPLYDSLRSISSVNQRMHQG